MTRRELLQVLGISPIVAATSVVKTPEVTYYRCITAEGFQNMMINNRVYPWDGATGYLRGYNDARNPSISR